MDVEPLLYQGQQLPPWLKLDVRTGALSAPRNQVIAEDLHFQVDFFHSEGKVGSIPCVILPQKPRSSAAAWVSATPKIIAHYEQRQSHLPRTPCRALGFQAQVAVGSTIGHLVTLHFANGAHATQRRGRRDYAEGGDAEKSVSLM